MTVFIKYRPGDIGVLRLAVRSWSARGWMPRILLPDMALPRKARAVSPREINYSFKRGRCRTVRFGRRGWKTAPVVKFPDTISEDQILTLRPL